MFTRFGFDFDFDSYDIIKEEDGQYVAIIDVPGVDKEDIKMDMVDGYLKVSTKRKDNNTHKHKYVKLYNNIEYDAISAKLSNGVLRITIPKKIEKKIKISIE